MRTPEDTATDPDALLRYGRVVSVDLAGARCTVALDDGDVVSTPPLRWIAPRMGQMLRAWAPPSEGEQVLVICPGGEIGAGLVLGGITCTANPAPSDQPVALLRFSDGAVFSYDPTTSALLLQLPSGATTTLVSDGGIAITGDIQLSGTLNASGDVVADGISLKSHTHGGVQAGGASTGEPE